MIKNRRKFIGLVLALGVTLSSIGATTQPVFASEEVIVQEIAEEETVIEEAAFDKETLKQEYLEHTGSEQIEVNGKNMTICSIGEGDKVAYFLPCLGITSPIIEYKAFATKLSEYGYKVIIVEPFGVGMSDGTQDIRTIENITAELHELTQKMGYTNYYMIQHSIGGIYALYYTNMYPNEVEGVITLDVSIPRQVENEVVTEATRVMYPEMVKQMIELGEELPVETYLSPIPGHTYTDKEKELACTMFYHTLLNETMISEHDQVAENMKKCKGMKFPCKYLGFISEENNVIYTEMKKGSTMEEINEIVEKIQYVASNEIRVVGENDLVDPNGWAAGHLETYDTQDESNISYIVGFGHYLHCFSKWSEMVEIAADWIQ